VIVEKIPGLSSLSPDEKILLAAELWRDAVGAEHEEPDPAVVESLRERLHYYQAHPRQVSSWEEVRARLISGKEA